MSEKKGFFSEIKNQIITTIGVIITAAGGLVVTNMEVLFGIDKDPQQIETAAVTITPIVLMIWFLISLKNPFFSLIFY